jgi:hypothetical protein
MMIRTAVKRGRITERKSAPRSGCWQGGVLLSHLVTGNKVDRAEPYAAQVKLGTLLLAGEWNRAFIDEHETFPLASTGSGRRCGRRVQKLRTGSTYDSSMMWVSPRTEEDREYETLTNHF